MSRTLRTLVAFALAVFLVTHARAADADPPRAARPIWGTVTGATADSLTIQPEAPARRRVRRGQAENPPPPPAERTFALAKDQTELMFAEVGMERPMVDGTMLRTLNDPEPATAADLKPGQLVQVTPADADGDAAKRVIIKWSAPGTIVKVDADTITFRPAAADKAGAPNRNDDAAADAAAAADAD